MLAPQIFKLLSSFLCTGWCQHHYFAYEKLLVLPISYFTFLRKSVNVFDNVSLHVKELNNEGLLELLAVNVVLLFIEYTLSLVFLTSVQLIHLYLTFSIFNAGIL